MHKHIVSALTLVAVAAGSVTPALAREGTGSGSATPSMRPIPSIRQEIKDRREGFREEIKDRLSNIRKDHIKNWLKRMQVRLGAIIERQHKLAVKIGERLDRAEKAGKDVSVPRAKLAEATVKIDAAKAALTDLTAQLESILTDNPPRDAFAKIHELQKGVFGKIREAQQALVQVIVSMRVTIGTSSPTPTPATP